MVCFGEVKYLILCLTKFLEGYVCEVREDVFWGRVLRSTVYYSACGAVLALDTM